MIIKHVNGDTVDTDKLGDISAISYEKAEELRKFCHEYDVPCIILIAPRQYNKFTSFWNFKRSNIPVDHNENGEPVIDIGYMLHGVDHMVRTITNNNYGVRKISSPHEL